MSIANVLWGKLLFGGQSGGGRLMNDDTPRAFLREWRLRCGLKQEELGDLTGDGKDQISRWENGRLKLKVEKAMALAEAMGLKPWQIFVNPDEATAILVGPEAELFLKWKRLPESDRALLEAQAARLLQTVRRSDEQDS